MRKISTLFILLNIVVSCSEDDSINGQQPAEFPTNITLSSQTAEIGEILTINGNEFLTNETYIITFTNNIIGTITEISSDFIKVEIPNGAISGNIELTFNNETSIIGNIEIISIIESRLFAHNSEVTPQKIVEIDMNTGNEINVIANINHTNNLSYFNFNSSTNEIICAYTDNISNIPHLYKINIANGQTTSIQSNRYENWIISNDNRLFAHNSEVTPQKIVEIDMNTGNEINVIANINHTNNLSYFNFNSSTNEIICAYTDNISSIPYLYKINIANGQTTSIQSNRYENWIINRN